MALPTEDSLRNQWTALSDWYEAKCLGMTSKIFRAFTEFLQLSQAQAVVETACGPGNGVDILRQLCPAETRIYASDLCPRFVAVTQEKRVPNTEVCIANAESLPYPDLFCDRYVCNLALMLVPQPDLLLREAYRVLQPGGLLAVSLWGSAAGCTLYQPAFEALRAAGISLPAPGTRSNFHLSQPDLLRRLLQDAGFPHPLVFTENAVLPFLAPEDFAEFFLSAPDLGKAVEAQSAEQVPRLRTALIDTFTRVLRLEGRTPVFEAYIIVARKP